MTSEPEGADCRLLPEAASQRAFLGAAALLFVLSSAVTIVWYESMSVMGGMPMPGGWAMSTVDEGRDR